MARPLTVKTMEALKPDPAKRHAIETPDGAVAGLYLVTQPSGAKSFSLRYRHLGKTRKLTLGGVEMGLATARKRAAEARVVIAGGGDPAGDKTQAREAGKAAEQTARHDSVEAVVGKFIALHVAKNTKPSTGKEYIRLLEKEIIPPWKGRRLADITKKDVNDLLDDIARRAPIGVNRVQALLHKLCKWSAARQIISHNPVEGVERRSDEAPRGRDRVLGDAELRIAWKASDTLGWPFDAIVKLLIVTGQRRGEVVGMRWPEVDLDQALWTLPGGPKGRTKNKQKHSVPLSSLALQILNSAPQIENKNELCFPTNREKSLNSVSNFSRAKSRLDRAIAEIVKLEEAKPIRPFSFHDLRRSCASGMGKLGIELHVIERCLNHISGSFGGIVGIYQKEKFELPMKLAMQKWSDHIETIINQSPTGNVVEFKQIAK